jgi:hypothetical protein
MDAAVTLSRSSWFDFTLISGGAVFGLAATALVALTPRDPLAPVAVVYAPWTQAGAAIGAATQAGAQLLRPGAHANIVIVKPDDAGYAARASAAGAWLVADAAALTGCAETVAP